jgi:hypothetical protein
LFPQEAQIFALINLVWPWWFDPEPGSAGSAIDADDAENEEDTLRQTDGGHPDLRSRGLG